MTKPKGPSISSTHFQFLTGKGGKGNVSLTVDESRRFVHIAKQLVNCANWEKKVDQEAVLKVAKVIERAIDNAEYKCQGLPFTLPNDEKISGGEYDNLNFQAPNIF